MSKSIRTTFVAVGLSVAAWLFLVACAGSSDTNVQKEMPQETPAVEMPAKTFSAGTAVDPFMGDWRGTLEIGDEKLPLVAQVIALGGNEYGAQFFAEFDKRQTPYVVMPGQVLEQILLLEGISAEGPYQGHKWSGAVKAGSSTGTLRGEKSGKFKLKRANRVSPTLGRPAPEGAVVLFDGTNLDKWEHLPGLNGLVNFAKLLDGDHAAAYARSSIWSASEQKAILELGSDDGVKAWLNGTVVHANNAARGAAAGQDRVDVVLNPGWNQLLLKITQGGGGWGAIARLANTDGSLLQNFGERNPDNPEQTNFREAMEANDGFLSLWEYSPAYREEGKEGSDLFDIAFAPETDMESVAWTPVRLEPPDPSPKWRLVDGAMEVVPGSRSLMVKEEFGDIELHIEFRSPFMPDKRGQARGNSGVYVHGRYEVQVLDSYGLEGKDNECGGIYKAGAPLVNMCAPPMQWQTYDITLRAPSFNEAGEKIANARISVTHNGVKIHDDLELSGPTPGGVSSVETGRGGLMLQDHSDLVQFRNIWIREMNGQKSIQTVNQ